MVYEPQAHHAYISACFCASTRVVGTHTPFQTFEGLILMHHTFFFLSELGQMSLSVII